jgi:hypothetical protein
MSSAGRKVLTAMWVVIALAVVVGAVWAHTHALDKERYWGAVRERQAYAEGRVDQGRADMALVDEVLFEMQPDPRGGPRIVPRFRLREELAADLTLLKDLKDAIWNDAGGYYSQTSTGVQERGEAMYNPLDDAVSP